MSYIQKFRIIYKVGPLRLNDPFFLALELTHSFRSLVDRFVLVMPHLNKRWLSFFAFLTAALIACVAAVGVVSFREGTKAKNKFSEHLLLNSPKFQLTRSWVDAYGVDLDTGNTNWTSSDLVLGMLFTIDSFDPNKSGTSVFLFEVRRL